MSITGNICIWSLVFLALFVYKCYSARSEFSQPNGAEGDAPKLEALVSSWGYDIQFHSVTTEDGYILGVFQLPVRDSPKSSVYLQHGILASSASFLANKRGLPYFLRDQGYDVWVGNARGTRFSREHVKLSENNQEFWDFSFHEMGVYDIPAILKYISAKSRKPQVHYVGHSMGTTMFLVMASCRPEKLNMVKSVVFLAPVARPVHMAMIKSPLTRKFLGIATKVLPSLGLTNYNYHPWVAKIAAGNPPTKPTSKTENKDTTAHHELTSKSQPVPATGNPQTKLNSQLKNKDNNDKVGTAPVDLTSHAPWFPAWQLFAKPVTSNPQTNPSPKTENEDSTETTDYTQTKLTSVPEKKVATETTSLASWWQSLMKPTAGAEPTPKTEHKENKDKTETADDSQTKLSSEPDNASLNPRLHETAPVETNSQAPWYQAWPIFAKPAAGNAQPKPAADNAQPKPAADNAQPKPAADNAQPKPAADNAQPKPAADNAQPKPTPKTKNKNDKAEIAPVESTNKSQPWLWFVKPAAVNPRPKRSTDNPQPKLTTLPENVDLNSHWPEITPEELTSKNPKFTEPDAKNRQTIPTPENENEDTIETVAEEAAGMKNGNENDFTIWKNLGFTNYNDFKTWFSKLAGNPATKTATKTAEVENTDVLKIAEECEEKKDCNADFDYENTQEMIWWYYDGTSIKNHRHFLQIAEAGRFQKFDYGEEINKIKYGGKTIPPKYPLRKIKLRIYLLSGGKDDIAQQEDIEWLHERLENSWLIEEGFEKFDHSTFNFGVGIDLVHNTVKTIIEAAENDQDPVLKTVELPHKDSEEEESSSEETSELEVLVEESSTEKSTKEPSEESSSKEESSENLSKKEISIYSSKQPEDLSKKESNEAKSEPTNVEKRWTETMFPGWKVDRLFNIKKSINK